MELILHIGTHKTGTSAVQECLYRNEDELAARGIYYAHRPRARALNQLAHLVATGRKREAAALVEHHVAGAKAQGASALLMSAESFFAMTMFFHKLEGEGVADYWAAEARTIELLDCVLPAGMPKRIVAFFRRQDRFLESVYAQTVRTRPIFESCEAFKETVAEALDYARHMRLWRGVFPNCLVFTYEETASDAARFFLRNVLGIDDSRKFDGLDRRVNTSLARDLVEYKRELNRSPSVIDQRMSNFVCAALERVVSDDGRHHDYLSTEARVALLGEVASGNALLSREFGMKPFPPAAGSKVSTPYPGLSPERAAELRWHHARLKRTPGYQIERVTLLLKQVTRRLRSTFAATASPRDSRGTRRGTHASKPS